MSPNEETIYPHMKSGEKTPLVINVDNGEDKNGVKGGAGSSYKKKKRLLALDILRGMTVFMMIVVNAQPGDKKWWPMDHAEFNGSIIYTLFFKFSYTLYFKGITPTDFIFPFFLWIMGYAMGIVYSRSIRNPNVIIEKKFLGLFKYKVRKGLYERVIKWVRITRRSLLLFLLGFGLSLLEHVFDFRVVRIPGVLQRIGICYFVVSVILHIFPTLLGQTLAIFNLHLIYLLLMFCIPYPNCAPGQISQRCSGEAYFDVGILGSQHIYRTTKYYDPEGIISTFTSFSTTFFGYLFYKISQRVKYKHEGNRYVLISMWFVFGFCLVFIGMILNEWLFPYNKHIWSTAFVFVTAGSAGIFLAIITYVVDILGYKFWTWLFIYVGVNPLFMYITPEYMNVVLDLIPVAVGKDPITGNTRTESLYFFLYRICFLTWIKPEQLTNAIFGIVYELLFVPWAVLFFYRGIFIKL